MRRIGMLVVILLSEAACPQIANAGAISGAWYGFTTYNFEYLLNGNLIGYGSGTNVPYELYLYYYPSSSTLEMVLSGEGAPGESFEGSPVPDPFGPNSASATLYNLDGYPGQNVANFFVTYAGFNQDGSINVSGGSAVADETIDTVNSSGTGYVAFYSFSAPPQPFPEPSSLVMAASAGLLLVAVVGIGRRRRVTPAS